MTSLLQLILHRRDLSRLVAVGAYSQHARLIALMYRLPASRIDEACAVERVMKEVTLARDGRDVALETLSWSEFGRAAGDAMAWLMTMKREHPRVYARFCTHENT